MQGPFGALVLWVPYVLGPLCFGSASLGSLLVLGESLGAGWSDPAFVGKTPRSSLTAIITRNDHHAAIIT